MGGLKTCEPLDGRILGTIERRLGMYSSNDDGIYHANRERSVAQQLGLREMEHFLPTFASVRRWKDRRSRCRPLFPGWFFVRMSLEQQLGSAGSGVACIVGF